MVRFFRKIFIVFWAVLGLVCAGGMVSASQRVDLPITLDYALLRTLIVGEAFTEIGETATLLNEGQGCLNLTLARPQISEQSGAIRLEISVDVHAGTPFGGNCYAPLQWQGYLVLYQRPQIDPISWELRFTTLRSELLTLDRQPAELAGLLWSLVESQVFTYLGAIAIDLAPPVNGLKEFLLPLFPEQVQTQTRRMLASLRPGAIMVEADSLRFQISADVERIYSPDETDMQAGLAGEELERLVALWENWDALLGYLIITLSKEVLDEAERQTLIDVLLETRYHFVAGLADKQVSHDFVREQFVSAWQQLAPIFKNHLLRDAEASQALGYLAFVSSADALLVFDRLGPTFGLEISRNGLIRLAQMLSADPSLLMYRHTVDPDLRQLFELDGGSLKPPELPQPQSDPGDSSINLPPALQLGRIARRLAFTGTACAADQPGLSEILQYKVPQGDVTDYVNRVDRIVDTASRSVLGQGKVPARLQPMFLLLIPAMAWQESCFRQFVVKNNQLTYLLSYNQSSVGLMQINERVWRGLYKQERLRWDIAYNANAGCEIAALYLHKYALRDKAQAEKLDDATLARLIYAMYNGGPGQYSKFLQRLESRKWYASDELFWQKYQWVSAGDSAQLLKCLVGG